MRGLRVSTVEVLTAGMIFVVVGSLFLLASLVGQIQEFFAMGLGIGLLGVLAILGVYIYIRVPLRPTWKSEEPLVGWRFWYTSGKMDASFGDDAMAFGLLQEEGRVMVGVTREPWVGAKLSAYCKNGNDHMAPNWSCSCGIYAMKGEQFLKEVSLDRVNFIYGRVALSGVVIEHEYGYRAQNAEILELIVVRHLDGNPFSEVHYQSDLKVASEIGVPVTQYDYPDFIKMMEVMYGHR